jgi:L-asparaginase II
MLALAVTKGWSTDDYHRIEHPLQQRMLREVARWSDVDDKGIGVAVDGCGVACFSVPLRDMAAALARFSVAAASGGGPGRVVSAMTSYPFMVGGTGRACTEVMERTGFGTFVKVGAEGVYVGGAPERGLGLAIKIGDGARRAVEVALLRVLTLLDLLGDADLEALGSWVKPPVHNTRGEVVGHIRAAFDLTWS